MTQLDHLILPVNDLKTSLRFYRDVFGFDAEGEDGPFTVVRVTPDFVLLIAPWGTEGGLHLAFSMTPDEFDRAFARIQDARLAYGDDPHEPDNGRGPGQETGARGMGPTLYVRDPSNHLIELRHYGG
jgi:catechol 2,3-dioxygenase-like lactoylglutathione lyase family enzyme